MPGPLRSTSPDRALSIAGCLRRRRTLPFPPKLVRLRAEECSRCDPSDTKVGVTVVRSRSARRRYRPHSPRPSRSSRYPRGHGTLAAVAGADWESSEGMTFARVRALIFVAVLFISAGVVVIMAIGQDTQTRTITANGLCPAGLVPAKVIMPERNQVTINVFNGTARVGLAEQIGGEFKNRGFNVNKMETVADGQDLRRDRGHHVRARGGRRRPWLVSAYFLVDEAEMNFDIDAPGRRGRRHPRHRVPAARHDHRGEPVHRRARQPDCSRRHLRGAAPDARTSPAVTVRRPRSSSHEEVVQGACRAGGAASTMAGPGGDPRRPVTSSPPPSATRPPAAWSHGLSPFS